MEDVNDWAPPTQIVGKKKMRERRKLGWTSNAQPISDA